MNEEQQELLNEAYDNFVNVVDEKWQKSDVGDLDDFIYDGLLIDGYDDNGKWFARIPTQDEFINKCKTNPEFSERWGLKIEERELTTVRERKKYDIHFDDLIGEYPDHHETLDKRGVPRKLITITYNNREL